MTDRPDQLAPMIANATSEVRTQRPGTATYQDAEGRFVEGCAKCGGTGRYTRGYHYGVCFACKGTGKLKFAQPAEQRARNRISARAARARTAETNMTDFIAAFPAEHAWLEANKDRWDLAATFLGVIVKYGELSERQMGVIARGMRDASFAQQRLDRVAAAPVVDTAGVDRLKAAFDHAAGVAAEKGRKFSPRLTIGSMTISPAKATSANPGALYVKSDGTYLGKVMHGKFLRSRECDDGNEATVLRFIADPADAARVYGQESKMCCICNRKLTLEESMVRGMGEICASNFGW